jgi:hypothetical protein
MADDEHLRLLNLANREGLYEYSLDEIREYAKRNNLTW